METSRRRIRGATTVKCECVRSHRLCRFSAAFPLAAWPLRSNHTKDLCYYTVCPMHSNGEEEEEGGREGNMLKRAKGNYLKYHT